MDDVVRAHDMLVHAASIIVSRVPLLSLTSSTGKDDNNARRDGEICHPDDNDDRRVPAIDDVVNMCIAASGWEGL